MSPRSLLTLCLLALLIAPPYSAGASRKSKKSKTRYSIEGNFEGGLAMHLIETNDFASQRGRFSFQQNAKYSEYLSGAIGVSGWYEFAYRTQSERYGQQAVVEDDSMDFRLRNAYLQYKTNNWLLKVGNQDVVWGEAFGSFYSDIVNPKDFRNGVNGDFSDLRLQTPMINVKYIRSNFSLQGVLIAQPHFHVVPAPGNDYALPYRDFLGVPTIEVHRETSLPMNMANQEYGARASAFLEGLDLSVFYLDHFDRSPWYSVNPSTTLPTLVSLREHHARVGSVGFNASKDVGGWVFRLEGVNTSDRVLPVLTYAGIVPTIGTALVDNSVYVIEMDVPTWNKINVSLQWSEDILDSEPEGLLRPRRQSLATIRVQRPVFSASNFEIMFSRALGDEGQRARLGFTVPLNESFEARMGADIYSGPRSSEFGRIEQASRAFVFINYFMRH